MALHPDRHFGDGDGADDSKIRRCWGGERRFHLGSKRSPSCHTQELSIETVPLKTQSTHEVKSLLEPGSIGIIFIPTAGYQQ